MNTIPHTLDPLELISHATNVMVALLSGAKASVIQVQVSNGDRRERRRIQREVDQLLTAAYAAIDQDNAKKLEKVGGKLGQNFPTINIGALFGVSIAKKAFRCADLMMSVGFPTDQAADHSLRNGDVIFGTPLGTLAWLYESETNPVVRDTMVDFACRLINAGADVRTFVTAGSPSAGSATGSTVMAFMQRTDLWNAVESRLEATTLAPIAGLRHPTPPLVSAAAKSTAVRL